MFLGENMEDISYLKRKLLERSALCGSLPNANIIREKFIEATLLNDVFDTPHIIRIELINTLSCNAACHFCSNHKLSRETDMQEDVIDKLCEQIALNKTPSINVLGGEATTAPNFMPILRRLKELDVMSGFPCNGINHDQLDYEELKKNNILGVGSTLFDSIPENHDRIVGVEGAFNNVMEMRKKLLAHGLSFSVCTVVTRDMLENGALQRLIDFSKEIKCSLKINFVIPVGGAATEESMLTSDEIAEIKEQILQDHSLGTHCIFSGEKERCAMGRTFVGIMPTGEMIPCYFLPISLGNVLDTTFKEYLDYARQFPIFTRDGIPEGVCLLAESKRFFNEILKPLYSSDKKLPVDLRTDKELEKKLKEFRYTGN